jgi:hypothetical protein
MNWVEVTGYAATGLNIWGNLALARMSRTGWIIRMLTNVVYVIYAVQVSGGMPVVANHVLFFGINLYGFRRWQCESGSTPSSSKTGERLI